jgi:hypothetical protein
MLAASPVWAANGNIGIFFDQGAALCQATVPCGTTARIYVYALLEGASYIGITGAEYKVQTGPDANPDNPGWFWNVEVFNPTATVIGQAFTPTDNFPVPPPLNQRGVNVAWASCQIGDGFKILLQTIDVVNTDCNNTEELRLSVVKHDNPSNPFFVCPLFVLCDGPTYTKVCLGSDVRGPNAVPPCRNLNPPFANDAFCSTSGQGFLNPISTDRCRIGVANTSWQGVKQLYSR